MITAMIITIMCMVNIAIINLKLDQFFKFINKYSL